MMWLMDSEPEHLALPDWVQAEARMMVAEFLDREHFVRRLDALMPRDGGEFEEALIYGELALMADGVAPTEIAFRLAVVRATRDALMLQSSIRALPTGDGRLPPKREHLARDRSLSPTPPPSRSRWRSRIPFVGRWA